MGKKSASVSSSDFSDSEQEDNNQNKQQEQQFQQVQNQDDYKQRTLFLSGLPYECNEDDVKEFLCKNTKINYDQDFSEIKMPRYQDSGKSRGFAHVTLKNIDLVAEAMKNNKQKIGSRYIEIAQAKGIQARSSGNTKESVPKDCFTIFVKNLPYDTTEDKVGDFFKECGKINNIRFSYNSTQNHFKGFGYIEFNQNYSVRKAMEFNGRLFNGRPLYVDFDMGAAKGGYKQRGDPEKLVKYNKDFVEKQQKIIKKEKKQQKLTSDLQNVSKRKSAVIDKKQLQSKKEEIQQKNNDKDSDSDEDSD